MKKKVVIIGAGPAGLTAGYELLKDNSNYDVTIIESSSLVGGISKTINYKNNYMDLGGHRFFSKDKRVIDFWLSVLPLNNSGDFGMLKRRRVSRIYYLEKFFDYPVTLNLTTIKNLGYFNTIACGFSYLYSLIFRRKENSLKDFYINRFGKRLYEIFFESYTTKIWGRDPSMIMPDWGSQRVKGISIIEVVLNALGLKKEKETSLIEEFYYPKYGPGQLWERVCNLYKEMGGKILLEHEVKKIICDKKRILEVVVSNNGQMKRIKGDIFISSMAIKDLMMCFSNAVPKKVLCVANNLPYRDFMTVGLLVSNLKLVNNTKIDTINDIPPDCWIYVQDKNVKLGRIQIFNNWSPYLVKDKNTVWLGLEYFTSEGDYLWKMSQDEFVKMAIDEVCKIGIIDAEAVIDYHVEKVKKAYPAYFDSYKDFDKVKDYLNTFDNLYCIGRNGQHRYNNMDHSMLTAMESVYNIKNNIKDKRNIWNVNIEGEYHEKK